MKAVIISILIFACTAAMGIAFYWALEKSPEFQAETAQLMKASFLQEETPIQLEAEGGELWVFPKDSEAWVFEIGGSVLKVKPPLPQITRSGESVSYPLVEDAPAWPEIKAALHSLVFTRLQLNPKPDAANTVEILAP